MKSWLEQQEDDKIKKLFPDEFEQTNTPATTIDEHLLRGFVGGEIFRVRKPSEPDASWCKDTLVKMWHAKKGTEIYDGDKSIRFKIDESALWQDHKLIVRKDNEPAPHFAIRGRLVISDDNTVKFEADPQGQWEVAMLRKKHPIQDMLNEHVKKFETRAKARITWLQWQEIDFALRWQNKGLPVIRPKHKKHFSSFTEMIQTVYDTIGYTPSLFIH
jgi:hypothetical protein